MNLKDEVKELISETINCYPDSNTIEVAKEEFLSLPDKILALVEAEKKAYAKSICLTAIEQAINTLVEDDIIYNPNDFLPSQLTEASNG